MEMAAVTLVKDTVLLLSQTSIAIKATLSFYYTDF